MLPESPGQTHSCVELLDERQIQIYRRMTGEQRLKIGFEICDFVRKLVLAGIRYRNPEATDAEVRRLLRQSYNA